MEEKEEGVQVGGDHKLQGLSLVVVVVIGFCAPRACVTKHGHQNERERGAYL